MTIIYIMSRIHKVHSCSVICDLLPEPTLQSRLTDHLIFIFCHSCHLSLSVSIKYDLTRAQLSIFRLHCVRWSEVCQQIRHCCVALRHLLHHRCLHWHIHQHQWKRSLEVSMHLKKTTWSLVSRVARQQKIFS